MIHRDVVDGVEVRWIEAPPPFSALLLFRVGLYDETLLTSGITHLIEHLALHPMHERRHMIDGSVDGRQATFAAAGSPDEVSEFLTTVSRNVAHLPVDRMEAEARVLGVESRARPATDFGKLLQGFFGVKGPGLLSFPELGLFRVQPYEVESWAAQCFTKSNAILLLTGEPPPDLRLPLPVGSGRRPPAPMEVRQFTSEEWPLLYATQPAGVSLGALTTRRPEANLAAQILAERLQRRLRHELGFVYQVDSVYEALTRDLAFVFFGAGCEPERSADVSFAFMEVVTQLAANGPTTAELEAVRRLPDPAHVEPAIFMRSEAYRLVSDELCGHRVIRTEDFVALRCDVDEASVAAAVRGFLDRALVIADSLYSGRLTPWALPAEARYFGKTYVRGRKSSSQFDSIVVGDDGFSALRNGDTVTFPFDDLAAYFVFSPSARGLLRIRGDAIRVDAADWKRGDVLIRDLDLSISPELRIELPASPE